MQLGCPSAPPQSLGITSSTHPWFATGDGTAHELGSTMADGTIIQCTSCHPSGASSFTQFSCLGCHTHDETTTDRLHLTVSGYKYSDSNGCYSCHPQGDHVSFDHSGITNLCSNCHDVGAQFAALPKPNFTHPATGGADCGGCHNTSDWQGAAGAPNAHDPAHDVTLMAQLPTFSDTSIVSMTPQTETLSMVMNHGSSDVSSDLLSNCMVCHPNGSKGNFFPGVFHATLTAQGVAQPTACSSCHVDAMPTGFVGPTATNPARTPPSGEMRHDAVAWANDMPTGNRIVSTNCGICHRSPSSGQTVTWATGKSTATVQFHASLTAGSQSQPTWCLDCHANSRPQAALTSTAAALPAGLSFDHASAAGALEDCASCHSNGSFTSWRGGKFHMAGDANPTSCLPCHDGERPTSTTGWTSTTYKNSPFDYVPTANGSTHGDGQDCALCHTGPGTGAWGGTQNWVGGQFGHGPTTHAADTCIACHSTQRPDLQPGTTAAQAAATLGFDHSLNGTGECIGCHAATVMAGSYVNYTNPNTHTLPGGDWKGGVSYPGSSLTSSGDQFISVTETTLIHDANNQVVGTTTVTDKIYNGMLHSSTILPAPLAAGPSGNPDNSKCWHCHTNNNGVVTAFKNGQYHSSLTNYRATPTGPVVPYAQPTSQCKDCHGAMVPDGVVEGSTDPTLWPMDHAATLATPIMIGSLTVNGVPDLDCSVCHTDPGGSWLGAGFHYVIPTTAVASDCTTCHYMTMADPTADLVSSTAYAMKHESSQLGPQKCPTCHTSAKPNRLLLPATWELWQPGTYHATVAAQPVTCVDCHLVSQPAAGTSTQSTFSYTLTTGATATNGGQWMNHGSSLVVGKDCGVCHATDASTTVTTWSKSISLHNAAPAARTCRECHGLTNGGGTTPGDRNNMPAGLTNSTVATSASAATGIAATTLSQISHADVNVTGNDCAFCHTQIGMATSAPLAGKEWAQAKFHASFVTASSLIMNGTTGRCSNCHMSDNPKASYTTFDHTKFTGAAGTQDCSGCHTYPGTGGVGSANWLGGSTTAMN